MAEFKLSYTASEIDRKLGKVDNLVSTVNGALPDANGNVNVPTGGIIDVLELPIENINMGAFYRLMTAYLVFNQRDQRANNYHCLCVDTLPDIGKPVTTDTTDMQIYYNLADGNVYGYIPAELGASMGVPAGWYTLDLLAPVFEVTWNGVIRDLGDDPCDDSFRLLVAYDYYIYHDSWCKVPIACETTPKIDILWDGEIGDRFALDLTPLGFADTAFVKISDDVFSVEQLIGATYTQLSGYRCDISADRIDSTQYPGALDVDSGIIIVYDADILNAALGLPNGYLTNGTYFVSIQTATGFFNYTEHLVIPARASKIDMSYINLNFQEIGNEFIKNDIFHRVAISGEYNDLYNKPTIYTDVIRYNADQSLGSSAKQRARNNIDVYSRSEIDAKITSGGVDLSAYAKTSDVETMIANAIGSAIGGSY